jgi:membrane protease YdiL (CAAX protease family)
MLLAHSKKSKEKRMLTEDIQVQEKTRFRLSDHPWMSLAVSWLIGILVLILVASIATSLGIPGEAPYRPLITPTLAHILVLFRITPFVLRLPKGKTTFRQYLDEIRLSHVRPFFPLLILGVSSSLIMLLVLSANSFIYRLVQGFPIQFTFIRRAIDLSGDLPPQSLSWIVAFPSIFEEVSWRGVMLVLFMKKYSPRKSILITAVGFGSFHLLNLLDGVAPDFVIRQVIFGSALGFFYGYLVLRTNSLMPAMLFHFLVNMFIGSFTHYFQRYAPAGTQILYTLINLPVATLILIAWVRVFCQRWIPKPINWQPIFFQREAS